MNGVITPEDFRMQMLKIKNDKGQWAEEAHIHMDQLMCETLISLGYKDGIDIYRGQEKYYS